jgi:hypothetical protein
VVRVELPAGAEAKAAPEPAIPDTPAV